MHHDERVFKGVLHYHTKKGWFPITPQELTRRLLAAETALREVTETLNRIKKSYNMA